MHQPNHEIVAVGPKPRLNARPILGESLDVLAVWFQIPQRYVMTVPPPHLASGPWKKQVELDFPY